MDTKQSPTRFWCLNGPATTSTVNVCAHGSRYEPVSCSSSPSTPSFALVDTPRSVQLIQWCSPLLDHHSGQPGVHADHPIMAYAYDGSLQRGHKVTFISSGILARRNQHALSSRRSTPAEPISASDKTPYQTFKRLLPHAETTEEVSHESDACLKD